MIISKIKGIISLVNQKRLTTVAGAWVYYFLISAVPIAFLFITAFSVLGVDVANELVSRLPSEFRTAGQAIAQTAKNASDSVTVFFIGTVIFSSTTLLNQMSKDGDFIYGSISKTRRGIFRRLWAVVALGALFGLFLVLALIFVLSGALRVKWVLDGQSQIMLTILAFLFIIIFSYAINLVLNAFICPYKLKFSQMALGALVSLFIMVLGTIIFMLYVRFFASYNIFYGSLAGIIIFLLWTYILMLGLSLGVIVNSQIITNSRSLFYVKNSKLYKTLW